MKIAIVLVVVLVCGLGIFLLWASRPWSLGERIQKGEIILLEPETVVGVEEHPSVVKIMTWNLSFLYGDGSTGAGYEHKEKAFYTDKVNRLIKHVKEWQPDIICLQEADFASSRTSFINQARSLALQAGYPYVAEAPSWQSNYIPFPYWPFSRHFGQMKSGGAILSKYPILEHQYHLLQKPSTYPWWYNLFYLHRYFQKVTIQMGEKKFKLINLHLEAFDKLNRHEQIKKLIATTKLENTDFVAGDFNMIPKSASKRSKFDNGDSYENDVSYELMMNSGLSEVIPDDIYAKYEANFFTFPAKKPDRRLDYIFFRKGLKMMKAEVHPADISDHFPLKASFQIDSPRYDPFSL